MMKYLFALLFCLLAGQAAFAQGEAPAAPREATNKPLDPVFGPKEFELKRFSAQLDRMQSAYQAKDIGKVTAFYSAILMSMRNVMQDRRDHVVALPTAAKDLENMQTIFGSFENFVGFDKASVEEAVAKFKLLTDFQTILQQQLAGLKG